MLRVEGLSAAYGPVRALDAVDLDVPAGEVTAVLGANGAGKTTLLRVLSGLVRPTAGTVTFDGQELSRVVVEDRVRRGMGHVPEGRGVIGELSVLENLRLGALWRKDRADREAALDEVLELFPPLVERRERAASTLSGGERQMLSVGRALMGRPKLLLLDEPSLGLAPQVAAQIMSLLRRLCRSAGLTVLLVEQNARSALSIADHGVVLNLGRVVADGPAADLQADEGLRRAYLGF